MHQINKEATTSQVVPGPLKACEQVQQDVLNIRQVPDNSMTTRKKKKY